jgi:O-antigen ligase
MHRGSWLVYCLVTLAYIIIQITRNKNEIPKLVIIPAYILLIAVSVFMLVYLNSSTDSLVSQDFLQNQLFRDTVNIRINLAKLGFSIMQKYPLGIGYYDFSVYGQLYYENGLRSISGKTLIIHNGYIGAGVKYGFAGIILFSLFFITELATTIQNKELSLESKTMIALMLLAFIVINITQDFSTLSSFPTLILAFILAKERSVAIS